ncbi:acyltransferase [Alteromonas sp. 009811495]|uniref:acyltransferase n=1 Tax=Alteromonas sp. 009811495 TaxID=3002962 RepID=UPI00237EC24E|nr:acyltransferase [Alteromonas sp. 009811495]WDT85600.1 acyltransferase [Alteromonas sp. 009811495]
MAFYNEDELSEFGFKSIGTNVLISDKASIYNPSKISIGDNVRIDDFCILSAGSGGITIGRNVHIACYALLIGAGKITVGDYVGLSSRVSVYSSSDDYSGAFLTNPTVPSEYTNVDTAPVSFGQHALIGSGSVILPGVSLAEGVAVGALSLVTKSLDAWQIYSGAPARRLKERKRDCLDLQKQYEGLRKQ